MRLKTLLVVVFSAALAVWLVPAAAASGGNGASSNSSVINVVHGIPAVAVDVCAKGSVTGNAFVKVITDFEFTQIEKLVLPAGTYDLAVVAKGAACTTPILSATGQAVPAGANISIIANLTAAGTPTLTVGVNDTSKLDKGKARVTAYHAAFAPTVNVCAAARDASNNAIAAYGAFGPVFSGVMNGQSGSLVVDANAYKIAIAAAGCAPAVKTIRAALKSGTNTIFYAVGSLTGGTFTVLSQKIKVDNGRSKARDDDGNDDDKDDDDKDDDGKSRGDHGKKDDRWKGKR